MVYRLPGPEIREELIEAFNAVRREDDYDTSWRLNTDAM